MDTVPGRCRPCAPVCCKRSVEQVVRANRRAITLPWQRSIARMPASASFPACSRACFSPRPAPPRPAYRKRKPAPPATPHPPSRLTPPGRASCRTTGSSARSRPSSSMHRTTSGSRTWGACGEPPDDDARYPYNARTAESPPPPQFGTVHGLVGSRDGLLHVADRRGNRIQVFQLDGTYVTEKTIAPLTRASGSAFVVAPAPRGPGGGGRIRAGGPSGGPVHPSPRDGCGLAWEHLRRRGIDGETGAEVHPGVNVNGRVIRTATGSPSHMADRNLPVRDVRMATPSKTVDPEPD